MNKINVSPTFIKTKNVRNFEVMMEGLALGQGEGRFGVVYGEAGLGKSRTTTWYMANRGGVYLYMLKIWKHNYTEFLQALCRELLIKPIPKRKGPAFTAAVDSLIKNPRPVFVDEVEKLSPSFVDIIRDLAELSACPFIFVGEEELLSYMKQSRRAWSRTHQQLEFESIGISDVIYYARDCTSQGTFGGIELPAECANLIQDESSGNFRVVKRTIQNLVQIMNAKQSLTIMPEMVKIALKTALRGN